MSQIKRVAQNTGKSKKVARKGLKSYQKSRKTMLRSIDKKRSGGWRKKGDLKFWVRITDKDRADKERERLQQKGHKVKLRTVNRGLTKADRDTGQFKVWDVYTDMKWYGQHK